jgi:hypothetical protein
MSRKKTAYARNAVTGVATAASTYDQAMVYDTAAGEDRVKPGTGTAGERFAGFANENAAAGQSIGLVQDGRAIPIAALDIQQGVVLVLAANGTVTPSTGAVGEIRVGKADSNAVATERVTVEISGTY